MSGFISLVSAQGEQQDVSGDAAERSSSPGQPDGWAQIKPPPLVISLVLSVLCTRNKPWKSYKSIFFNENKRGSKL